jgi:glycosyltransferase involved in cell wall biosynthesis
VVLPAFNQEQTIAGNLREILGRLDATGLDFEMLLVSDGSMDGTHSEARTLADPRVRVLRYDRNQGKGYALRTGTAAARGEWIAWIDSDLDLDPARIADFLQRARSENLDIVVGSKRHPSSDVSYPVRRRIYSWLYQQLVRALFALNVRDTQVGMKLFRREVLDEALPVVLVKRYAFDLEVLAVANSFGFDRIAEAPITLDYQFAGSGMNWRAITQALWDTAAVFYRLRLLGFYRRRRVLARRVARHRRATLPTLTIILAPDAPAPHLDEAVARMRAAAPAGTRVVVAWPGAEADAPRPVGAVTVVTGPGPRSERLEAALAGVETDAVAIVDHASQPSDGWARAALALLADPEVGAVVGPVVPRLNGSLANDAAGILAESRIGVGGTRIRHHVGRLREVGDFPARNIFIRTAAVRRALETGYSVDDRLCSVLNGRHGMAVLCSPDVVTTVSPAPLWRPHLSGLHRTGIASGRRVAAGHLPHLHTLAPVALLAGVLLTPFMMGRAGRWARAWAAGGALYTATVTAFAGVIVVLHRRPRLAALTAAGAVASHLAFGLGVVRGAVTGFARLRGASKIPRR